MERKVAGELKVTIAGPKGTASFPVWSQRDLLFSVMYDWSNKKEALNVILLFFQEAENLLCVTKDKVQRSILEGFAQIIKQLESSYETNKRKRKRDDGDDFDYLYGIMTTARDWHFLLFSPGEISLNSPLQSNLTRRPWTEVPTHINHCVVL